MPSRRWLGLIALLALLLAGGVAAQLRRADPPPGASASGAMAIAAPPAGRADDHADHPAPASGAARLDRAVPEADHARAGEPFLPSAPSEAIATADRSAPIGPAAESAPRPSPSPSRVTRGVDAPPARSRTILPTGPHLPGHKPNRDLVGKARVAANG